MQKKFAIVTGASTGIGRAIALELAKNDTFVGLVGRNKEKLEKTKSLVVESGGEAEILLLDLAKLDLIQPFITLVREKTSRVDILVNVAGIWHSEQEVYANKDFTSFSTQAIIDTYYVGLIAPTLLAHGLLPLMPKGSRIINISGTFENGAKGWLPYFVSKRVIEDLTIGLAQELALKGIRVNCVSPSDTATQAYKKYFPQYIDEAIEPIEIAKQVLYLCSTLTSNISGKVFVMKNGQEPREGYHS